MELQQKKGKGAVAKQKFSINDFKQSAGIVNVPDKPLEWLPLGVAWQDALGVPGLPIGYVSILTGFKNTGKSTALSLGIVEAQKKGILPIVIDAENNLSIERLKMMGLPDEENIIWIKNDFLLEKFGKPKDAKREEATIEDMADCVEFFLNQQAAGKLDMPLAFFIDSWGIHDCNQVVTARQNDTSQNNQWNAGAFERNFKSILNYRIPDSRRSDKKYTNTLVAIQKIWLEPNPVGQPTIRLRYGALSEFSGRMMIHFGGKKTSSIKFHTASSKSKEISWGNEVAIECVKNQIEGYGFTLKGSIISTPHGFIPPSDESKAAYKKKHLEMFRQKLEASNLSLDDIQSKTHIDPTNYDMDQLEN